eukprot:TRINITY_DN7997_c0_g1::TRINITY_DN7997_c0_g1_i1::g.15523::m.15523 TRINITY_DN7997_c0_g1::TRINITY_DN7997_c0_g1_i1::g.15523  ORF type:complete len:465 (-),score=30.19,sp/Q9NU19/TB22B_HUMAN/51.32/6e-117,RabGAP-TBC/PF00566.13/2.9e-50,Antimicrobial14/PF08109.6/0.35,Gly_acyl_tr_C/PF08444.5/5.3e+03,Gly_acyl_tr_C/PF08444.5/8.5e+02,Gly_acyl_tr_C/PF08444.5/2 TRINITY_DN7997_c0_g1_i1:188-1582(-)
MDDPAKIAEKMKKFFRGTRLPGKITRKSDDKRGSPMRFAQSMSTPHPTYQCACGDIACNCAQKAALSNLDCAIGNVKISDNPGSPQSPAHNRHSVAITPRSDPLKTNKPHAHSNQGSPSLHSSPANPLSSSEVETRQYQDRLEKFRRVLLQPVVDLEELRKLSWKGIPREVRSVTWQLLLGYLPTNADRRRAVLERKRKEYQEYVPLYFDIPENQRSEYDTTILHQIQVDVPRTWPDVPLFQHHTIAKILERALYIWAIRHPASGYVQGINDLLTPFLYVFLSEHVEDAATCDVNSVSSQVLAMVEADAYWCMSKLLDHVQENYTFAQPGIQRMVFKLKEVIHRVNAPLYEHFETQNLEFLQFSFRWMNCLLVREMTLPAVVRLWDTYLAEGEKFAVFHVYACAAFLSHFTDDLIHYDFQELIMFLQNLPTRNWRDKEIELVLSQAYLWKTLFDRSPNHLQLDG